MIPVPMSIMAPAPTVLVPTVSMVGKHLGARKDHPGLKLKENDENCGPTTTVFVGNISEKASDMLIRQLLAIGEKKLLVKVDAKTKAQLDEWKAKKKASNGSARPETVTNDDEEALDEETKRRDQMIKGAIEVLIREYSSELNAPSQESDSHPRKKKKEKKEDIFRRFPVAPLIPYPLITKEDINAIEMEEDKRDLISREISKFRDTHKRLKNWEIRERKKTREYEKEAEREEERRREMAKEAKRLKEFLEDYDDDRDDPKYYRGSALQKRLRDREKEMEADERDRKREKEELEEIRQRLLAEGHPDPDAELQRMEQEAERRRQPQIKQEPESEEEEEEKQEKEEKREEPMEEEEEPEQKPCLKPTLRPISSAPSVSSASGNATPNTPGDESPCGIIIPHENSPDQQQPEEHRPKIGLSLKLGASNSPGQPNSVKRKKLPVDSVFNKFEDEDSDDVPRKRKLVPLDYGEDDKNATKGTVNTEEKRKHIKSLIEKIPTAKPELFAYPLDWSIVDSVSSTLPVTLYVWTGFQCY
ncbi:RNA binding motif protein 25 [Cricetulus griseus]